MEPAAERNWNWIRVDLAPEQRRTVIGPGYSSKADAAEPMRVQIEVLVDLFPVMQPTAHQWLAGVEEHDSLVVGSIAYGL